MSNTTYANEAMIKFHKSVIINAIITEDISGIDGAIEVFCDNVVLYESDANGQLRFADNSVIYLYQNGFTQDDITLESNPYGIVL